MSEMKRVTLTTIGDVVKKSPFGGSGFEQSTDNFFTGGNGTAGSASSGTTKNGTTTATKQRKTVRLELELFEPTAKSFPEFNYSKLVREEQKRKRKVEKKAPTTNGFLSEPEGDDEVARIARELEKKYGQGTAYSSSGKFARPSQLDYCDRGAGYDEEDSFIDNTEAYDELIPQEVETVGGGFYINSGQLEFKTLSNFERPEDAMRMPKPKKRILSSSSDSSEAEETVSKAKKKDELGSGTSGAESAGKSSKVGRKRLNGHVGKKQKLNDEKKVAKSMVHKEGKKKKESKEIVASAGGGKEIKVIKTTTVKDMLRAKRDSMRKMEQEKKGRSSGSGSSSEAEEDGDDDEDDDENDDEEDGSDASDSDSSGSGSDESTSDSASGSDQETKVNGVEEPKKRIEVKLPDLPDLPDHLMQDLTSLKEIATNTSGKLNFFDIAVADLLLQIDVSSRMCGGSARNAIYKHLEGHLRVSRQTLMIKIKKIRIRKEDNKVKKALGKLEDAVTEMMPKIITNYEMEKLKATELRTTLPPCIENGENPELKYPKKKFPWNDQVRGLLYDIATIRKQSFHILRPRKETEEEYIHDYLKKSVIPLWPNGWMRFEDLQKELDRRKKVCTKEIKKTVQLSSSSTPVPPLTLANGPGSKPDTVLSPSVKPSEASKTEDKKVVRPPQSSPVVIANTLQPPPSTSPASVAKRTSDHSIINIISSPPSKSSSHSSTNPLQQQQQQQQSQQQQSQQQPQQQKQQPPQPPRPQSQPQRTSANFDEDLIQAHVINLETAHSVRKSSPPVVSTTTMDYLPKDLRINSPALSSASSASSSRRQSSYQDPPPMAHSTSTSAAVSTNRKDVKNRDDDSDSSIEIVGEYNVSDKRTDPLNLALPTLNKDKYKKIGNTNKSSKQSSGSGSSSGVGASSMNINNNMDKAKFNAAAAAAAAVGGFTLPSMAGLMQDLKSSHGVSPRMGSAPGELDVIRIMKELQELQAIQINSIKKNATPGDKQKSAHSSPVPKKMESSNHQTQSAPAPQRQQQSHHKIQSVNMNGSGGNRINTGAKPKVLNPVAAAIKKAGQN